MSELDQVLQEDSVKNPMALTLAQEVLAYHKKAEATPNEYVFVEHRGPYYKKRGARYELSRGLSEYHILMDTSAWDL